MEGVKWSNGALILFGAGWCAKRHGRQRVGSFHARVKRVGGFHAKVNIVSFHASWRALKPPLESMVWN